MTRDEARAVWAASGLTYADLTLGNLQSLRDLINAEMKQSDLFAPSGRTGGTYRMNAKIDADIGVEGWWAALTCRAYYFKNREAVTFNGGGFIGFAGWSDETNVQPILAGFSNWVASLTSQERKAA
ncbi:hypothetical protein GHK03_13925 [Sinorhizobium medicae]|uniref:hypothetical protein n=1 Tax=Sinorhizobium medicae TaxID=110321 RepID=UPI001296D416|nr:hypothetical protein [Sinorhizobium medicae]MQX97202.1 hypothetical protein [Sinorhizobium medicae]